MQHAVARLLLGDEINPAPTGNGFLVATKAPGPLVVMLNLRIMMDAQRTAPSKRVKVQSYGDR